MSEPILNWRAVLDHGMVRLVDHMGDDQMIVRAARVSYNAAPRNDGSDEKLIAYLMENKHTSPFEHVIFCFEAKAPIFNFRQWHRHRTWKYNEQSGRYSELEECFYVPALDQITTQSTHNKQMRTDEVNENAAEIQDEIRCACLESFRSYRKLLSLGCPRELARGVLPLNTYSKHFATVDLHNLFGFLRLRLHEHAQFEIRVYAEAMLDLIRPYVPAAVAAFERTL
jgi:thymidylate synthase (FAD)